MAASNEDTKDERKSDLTKSGRINTKVETKTEVVDNTAASGDRRDIEYDVEIGERPNGTVIHTYMEPKGGFPEKGEDA